MGHRTALGLALMMAATAPGRKHVFILARTNLIIVRSQNDCKCFYFASRTCNPIYIAHANYKKVCSFTGPLHPDAPRIG